MKFKNYVRVQSLAEAYALNQKKSNRVLGGTLWMRQSRGQFGTAIDLSGLGLNQIEETEEAFYIGCMATLRQLELHEGLAAYTDGAMRESVRHIVGVQFRNLATVGGSLFGRFGFSDVLTMFLALDAEVELYPSGIMPLAEFAQAKKNDEILVRVIVKKQKQTCVYLSQRNTKTDFPVLTCALSWGEAGGKAVIGATPARAKVYELPELAEVVLREKKGTVLEGTVCVDASIKRAEQKESDVNGLTGENGETEYLAKIAQEIAAQVKTGSNMRGSAEYRTHLAAVLVRRGLVDLLEKLGQKGANAGEMPETGDEQNATNAGVMSGTGDVQPADEKATNARVVSGTSDVQPADENTANTGAMLETNAEQGVLYANVPITFTLNGRKRTETVPADKKLYDFLREHGCYSVKCGCETSNCGLCTVLLDGTPVLSCSMLAARIDGHSVDTMEGLQKEAEEFGRFVAQQGAEQCGFCNPGMIMNAIALFREIPEPTDEEIQEYLAGNLCRCSGYEGQTRAIREFMKYRKNQ